MRPEGTWSQGRSLAELCPVAGPRGGREESGRGGRPAGKRHPQPLQQAGPCGWPDASMAIFNHSRYKELPNQVTRRKNPAGIYKEQPKEEGKVGGAGGLACPCHAQLCSGTIALGWSRTRPPGATRPSVPARGWARCTKLPPLCRRGCGLGTQPGSWPERMADSHRMLHQPGSMGCKCSSAGCPCLQTVPCIGQLPCPEGGASRPSLPVWRAPQGYAVSEWLVSFSSIAVTPAGLAAPRQVA